MLAANYPILVIVIPLIAAVVAFLAGLWKKELAWWVTALACLSSFLMAMSMLLSVLGGDTISYRLGGWEPPWGIEYVVDYLSAMVLAIVTFIALAVTLYAKRSVEQEIAPGKHAPFYALYLLMVAGLLGMTITGDVFNLFVFIEIASISGYALVAMGRSRDALISSFNYLILGTVAATFILIGIGYIYMVTGTLNMADLRMRLPELYDTRAVRTAFAFLTVGLSLKLALFPLHIWLPGAYTHAPSAVSSLLAATATKVGAYVLLRFMFTVFTVDFDLEIVPVTRIFIALSSAAIILGSVLAISQTNLKRMLAYSSVGQIGYIVLGAALVNELGLTGSIIHIFNHALMKGALFMVAGAVVYRTGSEQISDLRGMGRKMPFTMAAFTVGALSMIGVPLTVGFVSKWYLALGALEAGMWFLVPVILVSSLLTAVYFWRIVEAIYFRPFEAAAARPGHAFDGGGRPVREAPFTMVVPMAVLAALCIVFGIAAHLPVSVAGRAASLLLGS